VTKLSKDLESATAASEKIPAGWEPYAEEVGRIGSAIVRLPRPDHTERDLLIQAGFNPELWRIAGPINTRRWMRYDQEWLFYYKFDVEQGETAEAREVNVDDLAKFIRRRKRRSLVDDSIGDTYAYLASDWQIGKELNGVGTAETMQNVADTIDQAVADIKALRRAGFMIPNGFFGALGDLGEGTCGFYPNQPFTIDLNRRDQNRVVRELVTYGVDSLAPLFDSFKVATVAGNHGENRSSNGKVLTDDSDNDDVAQFEAVREAFARAGDPGIEWIIPRDELAIKVELSGVPVGMTHGHLFQRGPGGTAQRKAFEWWKDQDFGLQELRGTQVLLSAHFHHFSNVVYGTRSAIQMPPMDPGSKWFADIKGQNSPAGAVTMRFTADHKLGYDHLRILDPRGLTLAS
jgi:hypothetical protein